MSIILNKDELATNKLRKDALDIIEAAYLAIDTDKVLRKKIILQDNILTINSNQFDLSFYERVFFVGIGKCAFDGARTIENILGDRLTAGIVLDLKEGSLEKTRSYIGTHPYPSEQNVFASKEILEMVKNLTEKDLVINLISGGGSALFDIPTIPIEEIVGLTKALTEKGANICELNTVRKHFSEVKGGQFAKYCYPALVVSLVFSDVLGNDISMIASGPTILDTTTVEDAKKVLEKYEIGVDFSKMIETPKELKYFESTKNILIVSNLDALEAMQECALNLGYESTIETEKFSGNALEFGKNLSLREVNKKSCVLFGGETTLEIKNKEGVGGRNQSMALSALINIKKESLIACFASDGWDNTDHAGAIVDYELLQRSKELNIDPLEFLEKNDSYNFFKKVGGAISTGRLGSNVSDLVIMLYN